MIDSDKSGGYFMKHNIYVGTYSSNIFYGKFDSISGDLTITGESPQIENPSYLCLSKNILYAVSEIENGIVVSIDLRENKITSEQATNGAHPCHLSVCGNILAIANYSSGSLPIFDLEADGRICPSITSITHHGKSITDRQKSPHAHYVDYIDLYGGALAVCDLGIDKVIVYNGIIEKIELDCPAGSGPRHFAINRDCLYVNAELSNKVLVYKNRELIQEISTLPRDFTGNSTTAAIKISKDLLGVSNRGHDSVAYYKIANNGTLTLLDFIKSGNTPRDFAFSPDGNWLLCAGQTDNSVKICKVEGDIITDTGKCVSVPSPVCVLFD